MRSLRRTIQISDGVNVNLLFTPHLFTFEGVQGASFERKGVSEAVDESDLLARAKKTNTVFELYADVMFAAALNAWVLDGCGDVEDFPHKRGDFHAYMTADPESFGKTLNFALEALTGKTVQQLVESASETKADVKDAKSDDAPDNGVKKKTFFGWITRKSKHS